MELKSKLESLNNKKEPLTVEKIRTFKGFEKLTDIEAQEIIFAIKQLATIIVDYQQELEQRKGNDSEHQFKQTT